MKQLFIIITLLLTSVSFASLKSSHIELGGGDIKPTQQLKISLEKLVPDVGYTVTCQISDANNQENEVILSTFPELSGENIKFSLNGKEINYQYQLSRIENELVVNTLYSYNASLNFTNSDQDDSVTVDCSAKATVINGVRALL